MIDNVFLNRIGLNEDQIILLTDELNRENRFRQILYSERVSPSAIEPIIRTTDLSEIDFSCEDLLREKIRVEWADFIPKRG